MDLNQLTLPTTDLPRAVRFYQTLGLLQIVATEHYARFELPQGDSTFSLHVAEKLTASQALVYFECEDLDEQVRKLQQAGIVFDQLPTDQRWLWREARLRDPDGHRLCLYHAGVNRKHPPWRLPES